MRNSYLWLLFLLAIFVSNREGLAETRCSSSVSYKWRKIQSEIEIDVPLKSLEARGKDEGAAKAKLLVEIEREQRKARELCAAEHENLTGCVAAKYQSLGATLRQMNFSQRKSIEEAITSDCTAKQGLCSSIVVSEVKCEAIASEAEAPAAESKGKDEKKGKKK